MYVAIDGDPFAETVMFDGANCFLDFIFAKYFASKFSKFKFSSKKEKKKKKFGLALKLQM